ncbi:MAG: hypothetical protein R3D45_05285 [Rhizobiaceae bacterium]
MNALVKFAALGAALLALVLTNAYMAASPLEMSPVLNGARAAKQLAGGETDDDNAGIGRIEELTFVQAFSRPLFRPDRRKFEPPKPKPKPKPAKVAKKQPPKMQVPPPTFRVVGISINAAGARALIVGGPGGQPQWFAEGEAIGPWKLAAIENETVTLTHGAGEVSISLYPPDAQGQ